MSTSTSTGDTSPLPRSPSSSASPASSSSSPSSSSSTIDYPGLVQTFPSIVYGFGYGSGIFPQLGYTKNTSSPSLPPSIPSSKATVPSSSSSSSSSSPMLDFIFVVENSQEWHKQNLLQNKHHYSLLWRYLGYRWISYIQEYTGARIWYNTLVPVPSVAKPLEPHQRMKYGVISLEAFLEDCYQWKYFYLAGRLHKPVNIFVSSTLPSSSSPKAITEDERKVSSSSAASFSVCGTATRENLRHALRTALLILPSKFTAYDLYLTIASLSYTGDWRMVFGENPYKVRNIVDPQLARFHALYGPLLQTSFPMVQVDPDKVFSSSTDHASTTAASSTTILGITLPTLDVTSPLLDDTLLNQRIQTCLFLLQDTSPEARLALGLSLPLTIQKHMAEVYFHEQRIHTSTIIQRIRSFSKPSRYTTAIDRTGTGAVEGRRTTTGSAVSSASSSPDNSFTALRQLLHHPLSDNSTVSPTLFTVPSSLSSSSPSLALTYAERGKGILQRLRYQRLNRIITRKDKWKHRIQNIHEVKNRLFVVPTNGTNRTVNTDNETTVNDNKDGIESFPVSKAADTYITKLLHESSGMSTTAYARARKDPLIVSFWDAMLHETQTSSSASFASSSVASSFPTSVGDIGVPTSRYLRPSIAHTVSITARTQSIKGIVTAGPYKSLIYIQAKLEKYFKAILKK